MYAGNDIFCRGEVIACYNLRYRKEHCSLYSHLPCFFASELSMFSIKEPKAYLRSSWILLKTKLKVLDLFVDDHNSRLYSIAYLQHPAPRDLRKINAGNMMVKVH